MALPMATAMLKPDEPVSYAVKVIVGGSLTSWACVANAVGNAAASTSAAMRARSLTVLLLYRRMLLRAYSSTRCAGEAFLLRGNLVQCANG
jgi:hypothetical protein